MCSSTRWITPYVKQIWISSAVLINVMGQGMVLGYPSCFLSALRAPDSPIVTSIGDASWLASISSLTNVVGVLSSSYFMNTLGRRWAFILDVIPSITGWLLIYFGTNIPTLMAGRALSGISGGGTVILGAIYIGEYTCPKIRGVLLNLKTTLLCFGCMLVHYIGNYYHWKTVAAIAIIPKIIALMMSSTWPESPAWLASKEQYEKCEKEYFWLRGASRESSYEFRAMIQARKENVTEFTKKQTIHGKISEFFKKFTKRDFIIPVTIITVGGVLSESSGRHVFPTYAREIIDELTSDTKQSFYYTMLIDLIVTACAFFSCILVKFMNRRTLLFYTGTPAVIIICLLCLYKYLVSLTLFSDVGNWLPLSAFIIFFLLSNMGCTIVPYILIGEVLPLAHRGAGAIVSAIMVSVFRMVGVKVAPYMFKSFKVYGTFGIFGTVMGISLLLLYFLQPETKDKTLQEIEDNFKFRDYRKRVLNYDESKAMTT